MFKTDLHVHTSDVSPCASAAPEEMVEDYIKAGYSGIVVTNHYSPDFLNYTAKGETDPARLAELYLSGYRRAKAAADGRINVLLGMEIRFNENYNDYLIYGITEEFIEKSGNLLNGDFRSFSENVRKQGMLVFQAHPFRNNMTVTDPNLLDGIEIFNGNKNHDSRNDIAAAWAEKFNLLTAGGSDYHVAGGITGGGIITENPLTDNKELLSALNSRAVIMRGM